MNIDTRDASVFHISPNVLASDVPFGEKRQYSETRCVSRNKNADVTRILGPGKLRDVRSRAISPSRSRRRSSSECRARANFAERSLASARRCNIDLNPRMLIAPFYLMTHGEKEASININCFSDLYDFIACCLQQRDERERERCMHAHDRKVYLPAFVPTLPRHLARCHYCTIIIRAARGCIRSRYASQPIKDFTDRRARRFISSVAL